MVRLMMDVLEHLEEEIGIKLQQAIAARYALDLVKSAEHTI